MVTDFRTAQRDQARADWESALLAQALLETASLEDGDRRLLLKVWLPGSFNGAALAAAEAGTLGAGAFEWVPTGGDRLDLIWRAPYGVSMALGRVYPQENGTFAALVIAGVKEDMFAAMGAAEWAIARLSGDGG